MSHFQSLGLRSFNDGDYLLIVQGARFSRKFIVVVAVRDFLKNMPDGQSVTVVVGENGAGKSRLLKELATSEKSERAVYAISNTIYDRFVNMRGIRRISANAGRYLPQNLVKTAIISAASDSLIRLRGIADTLHYCGYEPDIGMSVQFRGGIDERLYSGDPIDGILTDIITLVESDPYFQRQEQLSIDELPQFLPIILNPDYRGQSIFWLSFGRDLLRSSQSEQATRVLAWEPYLRAAGIIDRIDLLLRHSDGSSVGMLMIDASSGQLTLIACLVFLSVSVTQGSLVLIDEPENSLHPRWQREYIERLLGILRYRDATIVIATHAPIIVSGAQLVDDANVKVYRLTPAGLDLVDRKLRPGEKTSLEETVFESFGTVTPANHFVSETLSREFAKLRAGSTTADDVAVIVKQMMEGSFDQQQTEFLGGIADLAKSIEAHRNNFGDADG